MAEYPRYSEEAALGSTDFAESETLMHGHDLGGSQKSMLSRLNLNHKTHYILNGILTIVLIWSIIGTWIYGNTVRGQNATNISQGRYYCMWESL
jgi:hypothetical protein